MDITLYLDPLYEFLYLPPDALLWRLLALYGWIPFAFVFMYFVWEWYVYELQNLWASKQKSVLLAIDIPKGNDQSPKAVENFFTYLAGAHKTLNLVDKYVDGQFPVSFSCEIVSIGGYTQFVINTPLQFRHLVEAAMYSQYPDAEIMEIQDFTAGFPRSFPHDEFDTWGTEFILTDPNDLLPIKTYKDFEHILGKPEANFRDPMSSLMDLCSSLRPGENLWFQLLVCPTDTSWTKRGAVEIAKILGEKAKSKAGPLSSIADMIADTLGYLTGVHFNVKNEEKKKEESAKKMLDLKPDEKKKVEGIQEKISKLGFLCKMRLVYMTRKELMNKPKVANGFVGYIKQFGYNDLNAIKPDTKVTQTSASYFMKDYRNNIRRGRVVRAYMGRSFGAGRNPFILNIEELATLWHFPIEHVVKAPLIQKTPGRKAEPPTALPISDDVSSANRLVNEIFVSDHERSPQPVYKPENIFDIGMGEDAVVDKANGQLDNQAAIANSDPFADIFVEPGRPEVGAKKVDINNQAAPPSNLPFA